jgi:predicted nucleic acid-binding protein
LKGYTCSGSFGILLKAKEKGFISEIKPLLEIAQSNGIRLSKNLIELILREANEF